MYMYLYSNLVARSFNHLIGDAFDLLLDNWIGILPAQKRSEAPDRVLIVCHSLIPGRRTHQSLLLCDGHHCPAHNTDASLNKFIFINI